MLIIRKLDSTEKKNCGKTWVYFRIHLNEKLQRKSRANSEIIIYFKISK